MGWYSDSLQPGRSGDFPHPFRPALGPTQPSVQWVPCLSGLGRGAAYPPPSKCGGHEMVGLYLNSPSGPLWPVIGRTFTFIYMYIYIHVVHTSKYFSIRPLIPENQNSYLSV